MHPHRPLQNNPIARLNLPAPLWGPAEEPAEMAEPSPVEVPDFPPEAAAVSEGSVEFPGGEPATFSSGLADEARPVPGGNLSDR